MRKVSWDEFYNALCDAEKRGLNPMPSPRNNDWVCKKTGELFGRSVVGMTYYPTTREYFLNDGEEECL